MKGITAFMIEILLFLLVLTLLFFISEPMRKVLVAGKPSTSAPPFFSSSTTTFDYTNYILSSNPVNMDDYDSYNSELCKKLMNALKYAVMTGRPYKVDEIAYGSDLISSISFPFIGNCSEETLETKIANGLNQKVCDFKRINTNSPVGRDDYGGVSDAAELSFDNCFYETVSYSTLYGGGVGPEEELNHAPDTVNLFYSPDYLYIKNGDYAHHFSLVFPPPFNYITNATAFDNAYNGPGRLKIYVGDAQSKNGDCVFNIYFCPRPAIAKSLEYSTINIFNLFKDLELAAFKFEFRPYYITDLSDPALQMTVYSVPLPIGPLDITFSKKVYYWNYYDVDLDGNYNVETILNAIKEGLYLNANGKNYFFDHPHWDIARDVTIDKGRDCWSPGYDTNLSSYDFFYRTRSIRFNCGDDNICSGQVRIKIAMRLDYKEQDINNDENLEELNYISDFISFCDEGTIGVYCGNNRIDGFEPCDKTDLGGKKCEDLGYRTGTLGCKPDCTFDTSGCIPFVCGDNIKNGFEQCDCGATSDCADEGGGDLGGASCASIGYKSGTLGCKPDCTFDTSSCVPHVCGDGIKGPSEQCDGSDLGEKKCADLGYTPTCPDKCENSKEYRTGSGGGVGSLSCKPDCTFDTSSCLACTYASVKDCVFGCKDNLNCYGGKWCPSYGGIENGCGDSSDGFFDPCVGSQCWTTALCIREDSSPPTCTWTDLYVGFCFGCCSATKTCTATGCYLTDDCKYVGGGSGGAG